MMRQIPAVDLAFRVGRRVTCGGGASHGERISDPTGSSAGACGRRSPSRACSVIALVLECMRQRDEHRQAPATRRPRPTSGTTAPVVKTLGTGVTKRSIKLGVGLIDYDTIKDVHRPRPDPAAPEEIYTAFIKNINDHGGIAGRKIVPVFKKYLPDRQHRSSRRALVHRGRPGVRRHRDVLRPVRRRADVRAEAAPARAPHVRRHASDHGQAPPGLIVTPASTPERLVEVLLELLDEAPHLDGRTVAVLGDTPSAAIVNDDDRARLEEAGREARRHRPAHDQRRRHDRSRRTQLDSFIEKWKTEHVERRVPLGLRGVGRCSSSRSAQGDAGRAAARRQRRRSSSYGAAAAEARRTDAEPVRRNRSPPAARTHAEYDASANWKYCKDIYKKETGKTAPGPDDRDPVQGRQDADARHLRRDQRRVPARHDVPRHRRQGRPVPQQHELGEHRRTLRHDREPRFRPLLVAAATASTTPTTTSDSRSSTRRSRPTGTASRSLRWKNVPK